MNSKTRKRLARLEHKLAEAQRRAWHAEHMRRITEKQFEEKMLLIDAILDRVHRVGSTSGCESVAFTTHVSLLELRHLAPQSLGDAAILRSVKTHIRRAMTESLLSLERADRRRQALRERESAFFMLPDWEDR